MTSREKRLIEATLTCHRYNRSPIQLTWPIQNVWIHAAKLEKERQDVLKFQPTGSDLSLDSAQL